MGLINFLFVGAFLFLLISYIGSMAKPQSESLKKNFGENVDRKKISSGYLPLLAIFFLGIGFTAPSETRSNLEPTSNTVATARQVQTASEPKVEEPAEEIKPVIETKTINQVKKLPFKVVTRLDSNLPKGQNKVLREGKNGQKTLKYKVTLTDGKETKRELISQKVSLKPVDKIIAKGTYVYVAPKPAPAPTPSSGSCDGYINSLGNCIPSPSSNPQGASAKCHDGTYSYSQHRRGTCSHHGGVAVWY